MQPQPTLSRRGRCPVCPCSAPSRRPRPSPPRRQAPPLCRHRRQHRSREASQALTRHLTFNHCSMEAYKTCYLLFFAPKKVSNARHIDASAGGHRRGRKVVANGTDHAFRLSWPGQCQIPQVVSITLTYLHQQVIQCPFVCRDYVISYDRRTRTAHWVFEHLTRDSVKRNEAVDRTKSEFREDNSIHRYFRAQVHVCAWRRSTSNLN